MAPPPPHKPGAQRSSWRTLRMGRLSWFAWNTALLQRPAILDRASQVAEDLSNETPEGVRTGKNALT